MGPRPHPGLLADAREYLPQATAFDAARAIPIATVVELLGGPARVRVEPVPIPRDCSDGFVAAYWRRPAAYLAPVVRARDEIDAGYRRVVADQ